MESATTALPAQPRFPAALAALARRAARRARHAPDRLLHPWRRAAALARVRAEPLPESVLFVCTGNIYRSPYAAAALERCLPGALRAAVRVSSAGFVGPGRPPPEPAVRVAARRSVDLSAHRSSLITAERVRAAALVVVMDPRHASALRARFGPAALRVELLGDFDPQPIDTRAVRDPWGAGDDVLEASYGRVERCVGALARAMVGGSA
ncbi:MAG TPA: hypothetical protein VF746_10465 [Longimicrobium sp.]|jgi:protein-tyrosine phosphatase